MHQTNRMSEHMGGYANAHSLWSKGTLLTDLPSFLTLHNQDKVGPAISE